MIEIDVRVPASLAAADVPARVEEACAAEALIMAMRGTLATYPGCDHWHYKKPGEKGTLEITHWGKTNRLWFKVTNDREGPWIGPAMQRLKRALEAA